MEVIQWTVGLLVTINVFVTGFIANRLWAHVVECKSVAEKVSAVESDVERMKQDIGTHDTGMRGELHATSNLCTQHEFKLALMERHK